MSPACGAQSADQTRASASGYSSLVNRPVARSRARAPPGRPRAPSARRAGRRRRRRGGSGARRRRAGPPPQPVSARHARDPPLERPRRPVPRASRSGRRRRSPPRPRGPRRAGRPVVGATGRRAPAREVGLTASSASSGWSSEGCRTCQRSPSASASGNSALDRGLRVVGHQDQRVVGEKAVEAAGRLDQLRRSAVGLLDRVGGRLRPVAVGVVVVVGEREEQEVIEPGRRQLRRAARGVLVATAGDRGRLAGDGPACVELAVEELPGPQVCMAELEPGRIDRTAHEAVEARRRDGCARGR